MIVNVKLNEGAIMPTKAHKEDAGFDLYCKEDFLLPKNGSCVVDTGVCVEIPYGYVGMIKSKSGLNIKSGITTEGVIDSGYTGSIVVKLRNDSDADFVFSRGNKITQLVILPIPEITLNEVDELDNTERGANGFGSTGK